MLGIASKINPVVVLCEHFKTFGDAERRGRWKDVILFYALPLCFGLLAWNSERHFNSEQCASVAINVLSIFVPLAFSVLAELFAIIDRNSMPENSVLKQLATDLFWNVSYGIFASIIALCVLVAIDFIGIEKGKWFDGVFVAATVHLFFIALMVLKRFAKLRDPSRR